MLISDLYLIISILSLVLSAAISAWPLTPTHSKPFLGLGVLGLVVSTVTYISSRVSPDFDAAQYIGLIMVSTAVISVGVLFKTKTVYEGVKTMSRLWIVIGLGCLLGLGYIIMALVLFLIANAALWTASKMKFYWLDTPYTISLEVLTPGVLPVIDEMLEAFELNISNIQLEQKASVLLTLEYTSSPINNHLFVKRLLSMRGIGHVTRV